MPLKWFLSKGNWEIRVKWIITSNLSIANVMFIGWIDGMIADRLTNFGDQSEILGVWCDENPCLTCLTCTCLIDLSSKSVIVQSNISRQYFINLVSTFIRFQDIFYVIKHILDNNFYLKGVRDFDLTNYFSLHLKKIASLIGWYLFGYKSSQHSFSIFIP